MIQSLLFDLDGTLADTAPDLGAAINRLLDEEGRSPLDLDLFRLHAANGSRGLLGLAFNIAPGDPRYDEMQQRFFAHYEETLCCNTSLFPGVMDLLRALDARSLPWGIVTNKPQRFTLPLTRTLGLQHAACIISGDSAGQPKPSPLPLLLACQTAGMQVEKTLYIGDDPRDIIAGRAAGMRTIAAAYGYVGSHSPVTTWHADAIVFHPLEILSVIQSFGLNFY